MPDGDQADKQSTMLKWILGLVATGLGSAAVWIGSQMKSQTDFTQKLVEKASEERAEQFKSAMENTKAVQLLSANIAANTETLKSIHNQSGEMVKYMKDLRDDTKKFPAVAEFPRPERP